MNLENLFYNFEEVADKDAVNKIAVNEEGVWGFITKVKTLNNTKIYIGFGIQKPSEWVSLTPRIMKSKLSFRAGIEICHSLQMEKTPDYMNPEIHVEISSPIVGNPGEPVQWNQVKLTDEEKSFMENFMKKSILPNLIPDPSDLQNILFPKDPNFKPFDPTKIGYQKPSTPINPEDFGIEGYYSQDPDPNWPEDDDDNQNMYPRRDTDE